MKKYVEKPIVAKSNYCVPAVMEMVLNHYGIFTLTQDKIAQQLSIVDATDDYDHREWGAHISNNTLNNFFAENEIVLHEDYIPISHIMDDYFLSEKIKSLLDNGYSIICGYTYTWLFGKQEDTFGHVSIIVDYIDKTDNVVLLDPGPKNAGYKEVGVEALFYAIKAAKDGLWCINKG